MVEAMVPLMFLLLNWIMYLWVFSPLLYFITYIAITFFILYIENFTNKNGCKKITKPCTRKEKTGKDLVILPVSIPPHHPHHQQLRDSTPGFKSTNQRHQ
jgi:hypothetical protein